MRTCPTVACDGVDVAETFNLPRIGDAMTEAEVVEWFVKVGDEVELDQVICAVETDKSVVELTSPHRGVVLQLGGAPGEVIQVGQPILTTGRAGEQVEAHAPVEGSTVHVQADTPAPDVALSTATPSMNWGPSTSSPLVRRLADEHQVDLTTVAGSGVGGRITRADVIGATAGASPTSASGASDSVRAMPKVRKLARDRGIELRSVGGSGPDGAITAADVETIVLGPTSGGRRERLSAMRRSIAAHLTESARTIPQFTSMVDLDAAALIATRDALR